MQGLCQALAHLAQQRRCMTYGALAEALGVPGPGRIAQLTSALEAMMDEDAARGAPLRAALVIGRTANGLPARGFFLKAQDLGFDVTDPAAFHSAQLETLFAARS